MRTTALLVAVACVACTGCTQPEPAPGESGAGVGGAAGSSTGGAGAAGGAAAGGSSGGAFAGGAAGSSSAGASTGGDTSGGAGTGGDASAPAGGPGNAGSSGGGAPSGGAAGIGGTSGGAGGSGQSGEAGVGPGGTGGSATALDTILLDDFEDGLRVVDPNAVEPRFKYLFSQYPTGDLSGGFTSPGLASVVGAGCRSGAFCLEDRVDGGGAYLQFFPYDGSNWLWMRDFTLPASDYQLDTYDRLRIWVKVPPGFDKLDGGRANMNVGTYIRRSDGDPYDAEDGGGHYYHHFNLPYTGAWHQLVVDTHPNHLRGNPGGLELGDLPHPTGESGYGYFDLLTRFYLDFQDIHDFASYPVTFLFDRFELYREPNPENVAQVYSLNAVYVPATNQIYVAWMRDKNENTTAHEVRYAFESVHAIGWNAATPAPGGNILPPGWGGYNGMEWTTTAIDVSGHSVIHVAIRPEGATTFREIAVPVI